MGYSLSQVTCTVFVSQPSTTHSSCSPQTADPKRCLNSRHCISPLWPLCWPLDYCLNFLLLSTLDHWCSHIAPGQSLWLPPSLRLIRGCCCGFYHPLATCLYMISEMLTLLSSTHWIHLVSLSWTGLVKSHLFGWCLGYVNIRCCVLWILGRILTRETNDGYRVRWLQVPTSYEYCNKGSILHYPPVVLLSTSHPCQPLCPHVERSYRAQVVRWLKIGFSKVFCRSFFLLKCLCLKYSTSQEVTFGKMEECLNQYSFLLRLTLKGGFVFFIDLNNFLVI